MTTALNADAAAMTDRSAQLARLHPYKPGCRKPPPGPSRCDAGPGQRLLAAHPGHRHDGSSRPHRGPPSGPPVQPQLRVGDRRLFRAVGSGALRRVRSGLGVLPSPAPKDSQPLPLTGVLRQRVDHDRPDRNAGRYQRHRSPGGLGWRERINHRVWLVQERYEAPRADLAPSGSAVLPASFPWIAITIYLVGPGADGHPPGFVDESSSRSSSSSTASPSTSAAIQTAGDVEGLPHRRTGIRHLVPHRQEPCSRGRSSPPPSHRVQRTKRSRVLGSGTLPGKIRDLAGHDDFGRQIGAAPTVAPLIGRHAHVPHSPKHATEVRNLCLPPRLRCPR